MTLPRHVLKRGLIEEAARVAEIPNGAAMMEEMAAQLRKYNCWACFAFPERRAARQREGPQGCFRQHQAGPF